MKRFHVHVAVPDLEQGIRFYSTLFAAEPAVVKPDYAKWMLEDPRVNFAISQRGGAPGVNHLGFQVDDAAELEEIHGRLAQASTAVAEENDVACCYARSDKYWVTDPAGIAWESFRSLGAVPFYGGGAADESGEGACCGENEAPAPAASCCAIPENREQGACCG